MQEQQDFTSVYRLQLTPQFPFKEVTKIVPYLHRLGIEGIYFSPYFQARPGSTHGYDVVNPLELNPELGSWEDYVEMCKTMQQKGLAHVLDLVANHMAACEENPWWRDVLQKGRHSPYSHYFDIYWEPFRGDFKEKIFLPILPLPLEEMLQGGCFSLQDQEGNFYLRVGEHTLPLSSSTPIDLIKQIHFHPKSELFRDLLQHQYYLLGYWQEGLERVNYRRFFDINDLAAVRVEDHKVFDHYHRFAFQLIKDGFVDALRIDHPDGLFEPEVYLRRVQKYSSYVVVEKILEWGEEIPHDWQISGTVGYEFLNLLTNIFIETKHKQAFTKIYEQFLKRSIHPEKELFQQKHAFAIYNMSSELKALCGRFLESTSTPFSYEELKETLADLIAVFPVYRTYIRKSDETLSSHDRQVLDIAFGRLETFCPHINKELLSVLKKIFFLEEQPSTRPFMMHFQQLTSPITAKGFEDTHLYTYNRFLALNEVGSNPWTFGRNIEVFHEQNFKRLTRFPHSFLPFSTHDTKRSEDFRMRLCAISEDPKEWQKKIKLWSRRFAKEKIPLENTYVPERNMEYFIYQTLVGTWPTDPLFDFGKYEKRVIQYLIKAVREAKVFTNWITPNENYERALRQFIRNILPSFRSDLYLKKMATLGQYNTYSALIARIGSPGVFDLYQGQEFFEYSMVDPDNRRPIDFETRKKTLSFLNTNNPDQCKMFIIKTGLHLRKQCPKLFLEGEYIPIQIVGKYAHCIIAFARVLGEEAILFVSARFFSYLLKKDFSHMPLKKIWGDTTLLLPKFLTNIHFYDVFTEQTYKEDNGKIPISELFMTYSFSILVSK